MNFNDEIFDYIDAHIDPEPEHLHRLDRQSHLQMVNGRMCSGHHQGRFLKMLTEMIRPQHALELGTFTGYSALCIAEGMAAAGVENPRLDTIEIFDENEDFILRAFSSTPVGKMINLIIGDALDLLPGFEKESYDLVFIDADKRVYPEYYRLVKPLLRRGGYIIADNTLWDGHVINPERNDSQTRGVKEFNEIVYEDNDMEKVIIPLRDGLTLIRKIK